MRQIFSLGALLCVLSILQGQTTYTSSPPIGVNTSCPQGPHGDCAGYYIHGSGVLNMQLVSVSSSQFRFRVSKCSGAFGTSGSAWIKQDGVCGAVVGGPVNYAAGAFSFDIYVDIPAGFTSGARNFYALIHVNNGNNEGYYAGPLAITATTSACPNLEVANFAVNPARIHPGESLVASCEVANTGTGAAPSSALYYYIDIQPGFNLPGTSIGSDAVGSLSPNGASYEAEAINFTPTAPVGQYYFKWKADGANTVTECDETDNVRYVAFWIDPTVGSNLRLGNAIQVTPNPAVNGQAATFTAQVRNNAPGVWQGSLRFNLLDGNGATVNLIHTEDNVSIGAGATYNFSYSTPSVSSPPGNYQVEALYSDINSNTWLSLNGGGYSNPQPFSIDAPSACATPDHTAFSAGLMTQTSFVADWPDVAGAVSYNINVKYAWDFDYSNPVFTGTSSSSAISVSGLLPNNDYKYQVQAVCPSGSGDYSPSSAAAFKTLGANDNFASIPAAGPNAYTSCPIDDFGFCNGFFVHGDGIVKLALVDILDTKFKFKIKKCAGTFSNSGLGYIKTGGQCGLEVGGPEIYSAGDSEIVVYVDIPANFSGPLNYYAVVATDTPNQDRYWAGPVAVSLNNTLSLLSPSGGETFQVGQSLPISWSSTGNIGNISIEMESYPFDPDDKFIIADGIPNTGSYNNYTIPVCAVGQYKIKIYETGNGPATVAFSQAPVTISLDPSSYGLQLTYPNGGQAFNAGDPYPTITWNTVGAVGNVSIELVDGQGNEVNLIADGAPNTGAFTPSPTDIFSDYFPNNAPQGDYKIKIYNTGCGSVVDFSDAAFTINSTYTGVCPCTIDDPSPAQAEAHTAISYLCEHCIIVPPAAPGYSVNPTEPIIREDLAKITFLGLFGNPNTATYADNFPTPFFDMQQASPYQRYGKVLSYLEYGDGISPFSRRFSNYNPGNPVTRGQVCKVYCEAFNIECNAVSEPFIDVEPDHPEYKYIAELVERGLINITGTHFRPNEDATREEAFILLYRILALCSDCKANALLPSQAESGPAADSAFFDPGNYTPYNLGRHPGFSEANFDAYSATGFYMADRGMPLAFGHSYNSYLTELPDEFFPHRPLGNGWVHTYHAYLIKVPYNDAIGAGEDILAAVWPDGTIHAYKDDGNANPEKITKGNYDEITWHSGGDYYTIKKKNQVTFKFEKINGANAAPYMLTEIRDRNDNVVSLAYQVHNYNDKLLARLLEVTGTTGRKLRFAYYSNSDKIHYVNDLALGRSLEFYLGNPNNLDTRLLWYKDAENKQTNYNYDNNSEDGYHLLKTITLPNGNFITNNYYEKKLTSSTTNNTTTNNTVQTNVAWGLINGGAARDTSTVSIYDGTSTRHYTYTINPLGKITQIETPTNNADIVYGDTDNPTLPTSITVAGLTTTYAYDMTGNVTDVCQEEGATHHFDYNSNNDITLYRNPRNKTTTFTYGDGKNLSLIDAPIGSTTITYYPYGLIHTVTNPEGITVTYEYDAYGNVDKMTAPEDISSSAVYDMGSRLKEFYNPNNQKTTYDYDDRNSIETVTHFLPNHPQYQQVATQYAYDDNGNLTEITNALGHVTELEYDYFDLLKRETFGTATRSYEYDLEGKLRKITKADGMELIYSYLQTEGLLQSDGYATYTYDSKYRLHTVSKDGKTITFNYDNLNRVTSTVYDGQTVQYVYDLNSNVEQIIYPGGNTVSYTYDDNDRMKTVTDWNSNVTEYFYLLDGRLNHATLPNGVITEYFYDNAGRMDSLVTRKGAAVICAYGFGLDKLGNHTLESKSEPFSYSSWPDIDETDYSYNNRNEIQSGGGKNFTHDNNGNVATIAGARDLTLTWDKHDMLTSVTGDFNAAYVYDGLGHRRQATRNNAVTKYVLDILGMSRILIERDASDNDQYYYVYGLGLVSRVKPNGDTRYYHYDFRGSTVAMTNETGAITHQYAYDEYGATLQVQEEDFNPFRFVGGFGVMQEDSTLLFMRARYYEASIGRFLSEDPIWSDNLYGYGGGNPIGNIDPEGELAIATAVALVIVGMEVIDIMPDVIMWNYTATAARYYKYIKKDDAMAEAYYQMANEEADNFARNRIKSRFLRYLSGKVTKYLIPDKVFTKLFGLTEGTFPIMNMSVNINKELAKDILSEFMENGTELAFNSIVTTAYKLSPKQSSSPSKLMKNQCEEIMSYEIMNMCVEPINMCK